MITVDVERLIAASQQIIASAKSMQVQTIADNAKAPFVSEAPDTERQTEQLASRITHTLTLHSEQEMSSNEDSQEQNDMQGECSS